MGKFEEKHDEQSQREICKEIIQYACFDDLSLDEACAKCGIVKNTFKRYLWKHQDLVDLYARSRDFQSNFIEEEIEKISNDLSRDKQFVKGDEVGNAVAVQRDKLRVETLQWLAKIRNRNRYGDKQDHTTNGKEIQTQNIINLGEGKKPE